MKQAKQDDSWHMSDAFGNGLSCCCQRRSLTSGMSSSPAPNRAAIEAILLLRTGMQWNALDATGLYFCAAAYRRFLEWSDVGVFATSGGWAYLQKQSPTLRDVTK